MRSPSSSSHSAPPLSSTVAALLKKTKHYDKDERYMATSDLCELLKRHAAAGDSNNSNANHSLDNTNGSNYNNNNNSNYSNNNNTSNNSSNWLDATTERDICRTVLELLHDKSHDVQAVAVKTLGVLLTTVQAEQVLEIAVSLTDQVLDANKSELRDVYAMGLRTLVQTCPTATGHKVAHLLTARLVEGIRTASSVSLEQQSFSHENTDNNNNNNNNNNAALVSLQNNRQEIVLACLDSLTDLLNRFGATAVAVTRHHEAILQLCLEQLAIVVVSSSAAGYATGQSASPVVRKRAGHTLACLSTVLSDALLSRLVQALLWAMEPPPPDNASRSAVVDTRSVVRTLCAVAAAVGHRLGAGQIDRILPLLLRFTRPADALTGDDDDDDENNDRHKDSTAEPDGIGEDTVTTAYSTSSANSSSQTNSMVLNELRESCLIGLESFVVRCPNEIEPHLESIVTAALAFMSYDPNYSYGEDPTNNDDDMGQDNNATEENEDAIEEDEEEDNYEDEDEDIEEDDDDDDESWKVRRSAIRVLMAVVESKRHNPAALWTNPYTLRRGPAAPIAMALVQRFKEREENCRVGVIDCFARLLVVSIEAATATLSSPADRGGLQFATDSDVAMMMMDADSPDNTENNGEIVHLQRDYAPALVKSCQTILAVKKGNDRSKSSTLALLGILCQAPGGVGGQAEITSVLSHAKLFLMVDENASMHREGTSKALRLDALSLVHSMLASHDTHNPSHLRNSLSKTLLPELCQAVNEQWYKVIAEALRALSEVPRIFVLGYDPAKDDVAAMEAERTKVAKMLYTAIEPLVAAHDVDQEIKECALKACAALLSSLHAYLASDQVGRLLALLLDRLNNETTRMAAIKTLSSMAAVESGCDLQPILAQSITAISSFLCLQSRSLNQCSMEALDVLVSNHGAVQDLSNGELYSSVLRELALHVTDRDLHLSHLSLCAAVAILRVCDDAGPAVKEHILDLALHLSTSSLLQDNALDSLLALFKQMILSNAIDFDELLLLLQQRLSSKVGKHGIYNLGKCIALITATTSANNFHKILNEIFNVLDGSQTPTEADAVLNIQLSLIITGDFGRMVDLSSLDDSASRLRSIYVGYFDSPLEDVKNAAAYALGNASVGSPSTFLQAIVGKLDEDDNKKHQYLLLSALREFIQCTSKLPDGVNDVAKCLEVVYPSLERHCSDEEEGVRTMVAECLGSLACLQPGIMLKNLEGLQIAHSTIVAPDCEIADDDLVSKKNAMVCWTVASSVKLCIAGKVDSSQLVLYMPTFVKLLQQNELNVRNAALLMVYSAVHHMPSAASCLMKESIMPSLYDVAKLKRERKVDLGPFTHTVDDALPHRKAALSIFATCLDNIPGCVDVTEFMPVLAKSLGDAEDIQLHAHQIVISMCNRQPMTVVTSLDSFVEPLEKTINKKPGQKTGTELDRLNDWIKSALRVILTLNHLEGSVNIRKWADFVERVKSNVKFESQLSSLEEER